MHGASLFYYENQQIKTVKYFVLKLTNNEIMHIMSKIFFL